MAVFADHAVKFFELGLNVIPIGENKRPYKGFSGFGKWYTNRQTEQDLEYMVAQYGGAPGIAICCGPASGVCGFDFDYKWQLDKNGNPRSAIKERDKFMLDHDMCEEVIKQYLPPWTLAKKAKDGWTQFFRYSPNWDTHTSNITCNRNGIRLFDFITHGYIVVPPSQHSYDQELKRLVFYDWIVGDPMSEFSDLPNVELGLIEDLKIRFTNGQKSAGMEGHRHGRIFLFVNATCKFEKDKEKLIDKVIAYDLETHKSDPQGPYFRDKKHVPQNDIRGFASRWIDRIVNFSQEKTVGKNAIKDELKLNQFDQFFIEKVPYGEPIKDILTKKIFYPSPTKEGSFIQGEELLEALECYAEPVGLKPAEVKRNFYRFQTEYKEEKLLCDIPDPDGRDYLREACNCVVSPKFTPDDIYHILMHWGVGIFRRIYDFDYQNRCVLFTGGQGRGKDTFVKNMVGGFSPYYQSVDFSVYPDELTAALQLCFVAHIEEFDQSRKYDSGFLKALITRKEVVNRSKYARAATTKRMAASWIATANIEHVLRDQTGNRRFIVIPVDKIDWNYPKSGKQIMAQWLHMYKTKGEYNLPAEVEAKISEVSDQLTPDNNQELILEQVQKHLRTVILDAKKNRETGFGNDNFMVFTVSGALVVRASDMVDVWKSIARSLEVSVKTVQNVAKKYGGRTEKLRYYRYPVDADVHYVADM